MTTGSDNDDLFLENDHFSSLDTIDARGGNDRIRIIDPLVEYKYPRVRVLGGSGFDILSAGGQIRADFHESVDDQMNGFLVERVLGGWITVTYEEVERVQLSGTIVGTQWLVTGTSADILSFYGGTSGQIRSQGGDDEVRLQGIFGGQVHVDGGTGNDLIDLTGIRAHPEAVRALGGDGADLLIGSVNADQLTGGSGSDVLIGRLGADVLIGGVADGADDALDWVDYAAGAAGFRSR